MHQKKREENQSKQVQIYTLKMRSKGAMLTVKEYRSNE